MENIISVKSLISKDERQQLYKMIYIGLSVYNRLLDENNELEKSQFFSEIKTKILNFNIKRQFEEDMLVKDFPFKIDIKEVNLFKCKALFAETPNARIKISSSPKPNKVFSGKKPPKYMLKEGELNSKYTRKIKIIMLENNNAKIEEEKCVFIVLGYGINNRKLSHLDFMIPEEDMKSLIDSFDGISEYYETVTLSKNDDSTEKRIIALKEEIKQVVNLK